MEMSTVWVTNVLNVLFVSMYYHFRALKRCVALPQHQSTVAVFLRMRLNNGVVALPIGRMKTFFQINVGQVVRVISSCGLGVTKVS